MSIGPEPPAPYSAPPSGYVVPKNPLVPKLTNPLTKFIRTGEGILVYAANAALVVIPIVTNALSATQAVKYGVILDSVAVAARSILKAFASKA